jgi:coenzyme F420 hydrogenase subunit delta
MVNSIPMCVINAGLSVREILFNIILSEKKPEKIIIVDAVDAARIPGEVFELDITEIPVNKIDDFSMHQLPTSNLLHELNKIQGIEVKILTIQVQPIPTEVSPGLSEVVLDAIPTACNKIFLHLK